MCIDEIHELIDFLPDSDLLVGIHGQSLLDLVEEPAFGFRKGAIHMGKDLFSQLFEILSEFLNGIVSLFFFGLEHGVSFVFEIGLPVVQLLLTLSSGFFVDLVLPVAFVEVKATVVEDLRVIPVLMLHAFFQVHDFRVF
jgi:hypothetical protein